MQERRPLAQPPKYQRLIMAPATVVDRAGGRGMSFCGMCMKCFVAGSKLKKCKYCSAAGLPLHLLS